MSKLHPGARWSFRLGVYGSLLFALIFLSFFANVWSQIFFSFNLFPLSFLICVVILVIIGEIYARMSYNRWFYEFNKDGLKLERGIIWKRYSNIPYDRIQNVDIHRGILARMLGFSTVMIQTAGYSVQHHAAEGNIPAVSMHDAEKIREFVMNNIKGKRKSGL